MPSAASNFDNQSLRGYLRMVETDYPEEFLRIQNEIDPNPVLRDRLVSVLLLGTSFQVPAGKDVGGDFANIPLCHSDHDTGCVITYASFRANKPPPV